MRDQMIHGVANSHVRNKSLSHGKHLTLDKAAENGFELETAQKANQAFGDAENVQRVGAAQDGGSAARRSWPPPRQDGTPYPRWLRVPPHLPDAGRRPKQGRMKSIQSSSTDRIGPFYRCGGFGHLASSRHCPARNKTCNFCRIKGPLAAVSRTKKQGESPVQNITPVQAQTAQTVSVLTVNTSLPSRRDLNVPVVVGHDVHMQLLVDAAATVPLMTKEDFNKFFDPKYQLVKTSVQLQNFSKQRI